MDHQADIVGPIFSNRCQEQTLVCQGRHTDEVEQKGEHLFSPFLQRPHTLSGCRTGNKEWLFSMMYIPSRT
jgi:hypothetical protein